MSTGIVEQKRVERKQELPKAKKEPERAKLRAAAEQADKGKAKTRAEKEAGDRLVAAKRPELKPGDNKSAPATFEDRVRGEPRAVREHIAKRVAEMGGVDAPKQTGLATLMPGAVSRRADIAGNLAHSLQRARASDNQKAIKQIEDRITKVFGDDGVKRVDDAFRKADAAGPRPKIYAPHSMPIKQDPHSAALHKALKPMAEDALYKRHVGTEKVEKLNDAYSKLSTEQRAKIDSEVEALKKDKSFLDGAVKAFEDTGSDLAAAGKLAFNLATDSAARKQFGENVDKIYAALKDPKTREKALDLIGSELGKGVVEAFTKFGKDPDYYAGYIAGTVAAGGAVGRLAKVAGVAAKLGTSKALDFGRQFKLEVDPNRLGTLGGTLKVKRVLPERLRGAADDINSLSGDFGTKSAIARTMTRADVNRVGRHFVGPDHTIERSPKNGNVWLVSKDGLRRYRPPSAKKSHHATTGVQANFETRRNGNADWFKDPHHVANVHVNVKK